MDIKITAKITIHVHLDWDQITRLIGLLKTIELFRELMI